uniref:Uncharacterized protein n=1 Tax=Romanomermis culicivorax TaxID=13658 RepID=A0A915HW42_ROMCU
MLMESSLFRKILKSGGQIRLFEAKARISLIFIMKPIYEDITSHEEDIPIEILEDITSNEDEVIVDDDDDDDDLENITSEEEEEEKEEEKTLDNNVSNEEGTILDYDDDEKDQYKSYTPHSSDESDEEEIYEPFQTGGGGHLCFMQPVGNEQIEEEY